jgi:hypothetical protein
MTLLRAAVFALLLGTASADEGMWMPQQMPALSERLAALGYRGDPKAFADLTGFPMGAIVSLGGCSASFVSSDGLIVTNHHCVQGALQFNSRPDRNLMRDGYLASKREDELPSGPGSRVFVTVAVEDVTQAVLGGIAASTTGRAYYDAIEQRTKALVAEREKEPGYRCTVSSFFEGMKYFAITQLEIRDVRLVYAPAAGIGNFGGETDNWQWPRHTGDFSFLRAYVGKDGKPASYAADNVPFKPKFWLKVSARGASPDEVVFVAGYPGRTARLNPYDEIKELVDYQIPRLIRRNSEQIAIFEKLSAEDPETALRVSTRVRGLNNSLTKNKGVLEGMVKGGLLEQKLEKEKALLAWIAADPARQQKYGTVLEQIARINAERRLTRERNQLANELPAMGSALGAAETLYRLAVERAKPDAERDPMFQQRQWPRLREGLERAQRNLDPKADRAILAYTLAAVAKLPADQRITAIDEAIGLKPGMPESDATKAIAAWIERVVSGTKLYDASFRLGLFEKTTADLNATQDSMIDVAARLFPLQEGIRTTAKERGGLLARLSPVYAEALLASEGNLVAPDANSTLRVTYGSVKGVENRDGLFYLPQTTLRGVQQKATGQGEFNAPATQLAAIHALRAGKTSRYVDAKRHDVPVDFLSTVDTTGGNSGSATLNARYELVGLLFDGTYDTVASDYFYDRERTRSIHCDTRYMLWVMSEVDHADALLRELTIVE